GGRGAAGAAGRPRRGAAGRGGGGRGRRGLASAPAGASAAALSFDAPTRVRFAPDRVALCVFIRSDWPRVSRSGSALPITPAGLEAAISLRFRRKSRRAAAAALRWVVKEGIPRPACTKVPKTGVT